ncbi:hypothetical protein B0H13DRAFT_1901118 [Mycena leptocephala]|nr:hypothetical protein B0H13DRAFT_1901118 [Mycena leptocephala]
MTFPKLFDAYVPSNGPEFFAAANFTPTYVPFSTLRAVAIDPVAQATSFAYAKKLTRPGVFNHLLRCFYFSLALLHTGFPSGTPGVPQIASAELALRVYHTSLLHDVGFSTLPEATTHPTHTMTFELHGGFMAYEHLRAAAPALDAHQLGDIVQSIVLHTSQWPFGNSSATQMLMSISSWFDVGGYNGAGLGGVDFKLLFDPGTVREIEEAYPRGSMYNTVVSSLSGEFAEKPNCLLSHTPGGLAALDKNVLVGPIVPETWSGRATRNLNLHLE